MTGALEVTWASSLFVEAGLVVQLRHNNWRAAPVFFGYLITDVLISLILMAVAWMNPQFYSNFWLLAQVIIVGLRVLVTFEAAMHMGHIAQLSRTIMTAAVASACLVAVICGALLTPPNVWPASFLETMYSVIAVSSIAQSAGLLFLACAQTGWLSNRPTRHAVILAVYYALNSACYFGAAHSQISMILMAGVGICYMLWCVLVSRQNAEDLIV